jgi:alanyl-tRNA synthetase
MADTGPCGPCSEIHFDRGAHLSEGPGCIPDHSEHCPRWLEIWNLVFMEFDQRPDGRVPLPFNSVDTGMGLERLASVLQQVPTNYDTDLFTPIHARMRELIGHDPEAFEAERFSYQVIADHSRAVTFLIGDDVLPSNEGRGYVLRRILRRAVRHGRLLGRREPFLAEAAAVVIEVMGEPYPHLVERRGEILDVIEREEAQFARTLDAGAKLLDASIRDLAPDAQREVGRRLEAVAGHAPTLPGETAFRLHDTYGFPFELTQEYLAEFGIRVDRAGFDVSMAEQRTRSRSGKKAELARQAELAGVYGAIQARAGDTRFIGYETTSAQGRVVAILRDGMEYDELTGHGEADLVLEQTPFYAEGGGQVGDRGVIREPGAGSELFTVSDTQKPVGGLVIHRGMLHGRLRVGESVEAIVDAERRAHTMRNHTGTHLVHRALRNVVGERARQAGSLVSPDYLRFDFPFDRALTGDELRAIEDEVHRIIRDDRPVSVAFMSMAEAIEGGADAFFDEKYGESVRTVRVQDYSFELCGGTHCRASGQVGGFLITSERSIGSGMRRIEAVTGAAADVLVRDRFSLLERAAGIAGAQTLDALPDRISTLEREVRDARRRLKSGGSGAIPKPGELATGAEEVAPGLRFVAAALPFDSMDSLKAMARDVSGQLGSGVVALALDADDPQLFITVSDDLVGRGISAGALMAAAMPAIDGRGGGRPAMAQGRGTLRAGLTDALAAIRSQLETETGA